MSWLPNQGPPVRRQPTGGRPSPPCRTNTRPSPRAALLHPKRKPARIEAGMELWTGEQVSCSTRASGLGRPGQLGSAT